MSQEKFAERIRITDQAIRHEEADRIPIWCQYGSTPFVLSDGMATYRDSMCRTMCAAYSPSQWRIFPAANS